MLTFNVELDQTMNTLPKIISGDGLSPDTAVLFESCRLEERIKAEYEFICERFGTENIHWFRGMHFTTICNQSNWNIDLDTGESVSIFFEIGDTDYDEE